MPSPVIKYESLNIFKAKNPGPKDQVFNVRINVYRYIIMNYYIVKAVKSPDGPAACDYRN
jgi:hypothetical protein